MYGLIRLVFGCAILCCLILIIKKSKTMHKRKQYIFSALVVVFLVTMLSFMPFENLFITFNSPEAAFKYVSSEKVKFVIQGKNSDLVIGEKDVANFTYLIVPKNDNGWKVGRGLDTKLRMKKVHNGIMIYVYQYKNTGDYYVTISDMSGEKLQIEDSHDSQFLSNIISKTYVTYYAAVFQIDSQYWIKINDEKVALFNE